MNFSDSEGGLVYRERLSPWHRLLVVVFGLFRFAIEVGESPVHFVVQDVGVMAAGLLGLWFCWRRSQHLKAEHDAKS